MSDGAEQLEVFEPGDVVNIPIGHLSSMAELKKIQSPAYNIEGWLQESTIAILFGLPGTIKTTHGVNFMGSITTGRPWCGRKVQQGLACYITLEDTPGLRARVEAWEQEYETLPPNALWWNGDFDFSDEGVGAVRSALEQAEKDHDMPVRLIVIDPFMLAFGEGTAVDEEDMRARIVTIKALMKPFPHVTVLVIQHTAWEGKHELGSVIQRALTATSIKADSNETLAELGLVRQKNDEEGIKRVFRKQTFPGPGRITVIHDASGITFSGTDALTESQSVMLRLIDEGGSEGHSVENLNTAAKKIGLATTKTGKTRTARLYELRGQLKDKKLVHETGDRWYITRI